jgi:ferredoxin--NADP+ reductase
LLPAARVRSISRTMAALTEQKVLQVHHWTERLFSFVTTRDPSFRFENGQFTMIGLHVRTRPLLRAYSMVSANHEEQLEFFSIKVPDGPLTSQLQHLRAGDSILVSRKPTGTLVLDGLLPGRRLWLLGTGTGLAPFLSLIKGPETYERFERVVLVHGCRGIADLAYGELITRELPRNEFLGENIARQLTYFPTVTREPFHNRGRITDLVSTGELTRRLALPPLDPAHDRIMVCGSPGMLKDMRALLDARGFLEAGGRGEPGHFAVERAFVES